MTALAERSRTKTGPATIVGLPQVNLLPPEIRAARGLRVVKRWLALALVLVVVACAGAWAVSWLDERSAASDLAVAQDETARLQSEQERYAEVPRVLGALSTTRLARTLGMATDILWAPYYQAIAAVLPADVSFENIAVTLGTPITTAAAPTSPLQALSIGQIQFTARALALPQTADWIDALNGIPGLGDAWVSSAAVQQNAEDGTVYYTVSATVQVNLTALSGRFFETEGEG